MEEKSSTYQNPLDPVPMETEQKEYRGGPVNAYERQDQTDSAPTSKGLITPEDPKTSMSKEKNFDRISKTSKTTIASSSPSHSNGLREATMAKNQMDTEAIDRNTSPNLRVTGAASGPVVKKTPQPLPILQSSFSPLAAQLMSTFPESPYTTPYRALNYVELHRKAAPMKRRSDSLIIIATKKKVYKNDIIMEAFGDVVLPEELEENQIPKNNEHLFKYPPHCHVHCEQREVFHIDIKFDGKYLRRSCTPNSTLVHFKTSEGLVRFFVRATEDIEMRKEVTVGFDHDFRFSKVPLKCAHHRGREERCKFEKHRKVVLREIVGEE